MGGDVEVGAPGALPPPPSSTGRSCQGTGNPLSLKHTHPITWPHLTDIHTPAPGTACFTITEGDALSSVPFQAATGKPAPETTNCFTPSRSRSRNSDRFSEDLGQASVEAGEPQDKTGGTCPTAGPRASPLNRGIGQVHQQPLEQPGINRSARRAPIQGFVHHPPHWLFVITQIGARAAVPVKIPIGEAECSPKNSWTTEVVGDSIELSVADTTQVTPAQGSTGAQVLAGTQV